MCAVEAPKLTMISPERPFSNKMVMWNTIRQCEEHIYWIDKYFSIEGLELLAESVDKSKVKSIKILTSVPNTSFKLRNLFDKFKNETANHGIDCQLRVIIDYATASKFHDRRDNTWIQDLELF